MAQIIAVLETRVIASYRLLRDVQLDDGAILQRVRKRPINTHVLIVYR